MGFSGTAVGDMRCGGVVQLSWLCGRCDSGLRFVCVVPWAWFLGAWFDLVVYFVCSCVA